MNTSFVSHAPPSLTSPALAEVVTAALKRIPPLWPLSNFVAVNPFLGFSNQPFAEACTLLHRVTGRAPLQEPAAYRHAYAEGHITREDLAFACTGDWTPESLEQGLFRAAQGPRTGGLFTVADLLDRSHAGKRWSAFVVEEISKWCSVFFDRNQCTWTFPWRSHGLYAGWREAAMIDRNPEFFGFPGFRKFVAALPPDAGTAIGCCLAILDPQTGSLVDLLHRQLFSIGGWAGYAQFLAREDSLRGRVNRSPEELLAIRLAYDAALYTAFVRDGVLRSDWRHQTIAQAPQRDASLLEHWQRAYEAGYQRSLARKLAHRPKAASEARSPVQAVFCIDVRSEVFRRHLERAMPGLKTIGFAGFFGFPVTYQRTGQPETARCPALLAPPFSCVDEAAPEDADRTVAQQTEAAAWKAVQNSAASCFSYVETVGLASLANLAAPTRRPTCSRATPRLESVPLEKRIELAAGALRNMSLTRNFSRIVLLCGHGSTSTNNPHSSSLDCGACGGHSGEVNARLAASTFNDPAVRAGLRNYDIHIPSDTWFVAGLHNTTTDEVSLFDLELVPGTQAPGCTNLRAALAKAGAASRMERAPALGLQRLVSTQLADAIRQRTLDPAEVRPEWGLANNAAFIAAPRNRTADLSLDGRVFLHEYDSACDPDNRILTLILSAPVVVASWINLQYYAARVDPTSYAAGDKLLHNVVSGLGAFEGNAGDLKTGLPLQSLHNGQRFIHEPRRLSVFIEARRAAISAALASIPEVRQLVDNRWIHLFAIEGEQCWTYSPQGWKPMSG